jgi:predicted enzyme related to lactoylglutathione lyase
VLHVSTVAPTWSTARPVRRGTPSVPRANETPSGYRSNVIELVLDCRDPDALARFWTAALTYEVVDASGPYRSLEPIGDDDPGPTLVLQAVSEPKVGKNRLHLDVYAPDLGAEASRLEDLGARRLTDEVVDEDGERWVVMADPEGNEFCVCEE